MSEWKLDSEIGRWALTNDPLWGTVHIWKWQPTLHLMTTPHYTHQHGSLPLISIFIDYLLLTAVPCRIKIDRRLKSINQSNWCIRWFTKTSLISIFRYLHSETVDKTLIFKRVFALDSVATRLTPDTSCNSGVSHYVCCGWQRVDSWPDYAPKVLAHVM